LSVDLRPLDSHTARAALLDAVIALVAEAMRVVMEIYSQPFEATLKADDSPLTAADLASHRLIVPGLARLDPPLPILSEEGIPPGPEREAWAAHWLVDPLDGTREFLAANGEFTINVALVEGARATMGVVGVPARGQIFTGDVVRGTAERRDASGVHRLGPHRYAGRRPVIVASRRHAGDRLERGLRALEAAHGPIERCAVGSALKLCLLADGKADVYPRIGPTSEWDVAAAQAVLESAGGSVVQLDGAPLRYRKPSVLNPDFVAAADPEIGWWRYFASPP
jgi:3'(2'), 5'-bisphosphate nucleotidase